MPFARLQGGEHVAAQPGRDGGVAAVEAPRGRDRVGRRGDRPRGQDERGRPALGVAGHGVEHLGLLGASVHPDQRVRLGLVQAKHVAPDHGEVTEQLGHQPGERQVVAREQQQPELLGRGGEPLVDQPQCRGRQQVRVVHHDERAPEGICGTGVTSVGLVEELGQSLRGPGAVAADPAGVLPVVRGAHPASDTEGLAGSDGSDQQTHARVGRLVELAPQPCAWHVDARQARSLDRGRHRLCARRRCPPSWCRAHKPLPGLPDLRTVPTHRSESGPPRTKARGHDVDASALIEMLGLVIHPAPDPGSSARRYELASSVLRAQMMKTSKPRITSDQSG